MQAKNNNTQSPNRVLSISEAVALIVGLVIGAGIFKTPSLVAVMSGSAHTMFCLWLAGGIISFLGALCYAELASAYPHAGGDYHFLDLAYGRRIAFLFGWARISVITTGSIALLAFVFGDYMNRIISLDFMGIPGPFLYALAIIVILSLVHLKNVHTGMLTQKIFTIIQVLCLLAIVATAIYLSFTSQISHSQLTSVSTPSENPAQFGMAMVFVLLTFGGWNEAAYISAEVKGAHKTIVRSLIIAISIITILYLLVTWAYYQVLGMQAMAHTTTIAADVMTFAFGDIAQKIISFMIAVCALTSINATIFVGARTSYAMGQDWPVLSWLGVWHKKRHTPANAIIAQAIASIILVILGALTGGGFISMVEFTAPVFWLFFLLSVFSLFILRHKYPQTARPFRVPFYPIIPILFCLSCAYMLYASLSYVYNQSLGGINAAWIGIGVLLIGTLVLWIINRFKTN